jgi:hypothetical protein
VTSECFCLLLNAVIGLQMNECPLTSQRKEKTQHSCEVFHLVDLCCSLLHHSCTFMLRANTVLICFIRVDFSFLFLGLCLPCVS